MELRSGSTVGAGILNPEHRATFEAGVRAIFTRWTALSLAVSQGWGGVNSAEKAEDFLAHTLNWFYRRKEHYADDLEVELDECIAAEFNVECEDGSPLMIARDIIRIYEECLRGDFSTVERLVAEQDAARRAALQKSQKQTLDLDGAVVSGSDEDMSDCERTEGDGPPQGVPLQQPHPLQHQQPQGPIIDDDGFEMVQRKGRRR